MSGWAAHRPLSRVVYGGAKVALGTSLSEPSTRIEAAALELQDSCYSSCSETESHASLSRNASAASETLGAETASLSLGEPLAVWTEEDADFRRLADFATKLGFSEAQLIAVLDNLQEFPPNQDRVLGELTKLGRDSPPALSPEAESSDAEADGGLRPIVIDGSNLAFTHGGKEIFSCQGIAECVDFFKARGHSDIKVFVPQFRREAPRADAPISDQELLTKLESEGILIWTPSRRVNGRRIVCHDDRYILKTAVEKEAVIVSNDEYRDLMKESSDFRRIVEERLLMYSFVDGRFMPPDDPLGRRGPSLDAFLRKALPPSPAAPLCPYARKCTYGNKCKFFHPERPGGVHVSVTQRLQDRSQRQKALLSARPSLSGGGARSGKMAALRTQSLNPPPGWALRSPSPSPHHLAVADHAALSRNRSAPGPSAQGLLSPLYPSAKERAESASDSHLNQGTAENPLFASTSNLFTPSRAVWGPMEFSVSPVWPLDAVDGGGAWSVEREKLFYHLSQLFPAPLVRNVMRERPQLADPAALCAILIAASQR